MARHAGINVGVYGGGGRDACLVELYSRDADKVYYFPGTPGLELTQKGRKGEIIYVPRVKEVPDVVKFCIENNVTILDAGSENSLSMGLIDAAEKAGIMGVGPKQEYVRIESDRHFTKELLEKHEVPIADYQAFTDAKQAMNYVEKADRPLVLKTNGLASGKGCEEFYLPDEKEIERAKEWIEAVMIGIPDEGGKIQKKFGSSGDKIIAEKFIQGSEFSYYAYLDGNTYLPLEMLAKDYKNACDEGDDECWKRFESSQKTGGMGAYTPHKMFSPELNEKILSRIVNPTVNAIYNDLGWGYKGVLYFGGTVTPEGDVFIFEINVRHGDPEWEVIGPKLSTPLIEISNGVCAGTLHKVKPEWNGYHFCDVVAAVGRSRRVTSDKKPKGWFPGYPKACGEGYRIEMPEGIFEDENLMVFFAGVNNHPERGLVTKGGRVAHFVGKGLTPEDAREKAYEWVGKARFLDHNDSSNNIIRFRRTIGLD